VTLDVDGDEGSLTVVQTQATLNVFDFVTVTGSLAFKEATGSFVLTNGTTHTSNTTALANVKYLEVGGHVDTAFAGVGGIGFNLQGVDFGMVLVTDTKGTTATADDISYTTFKADVDSASLVGIDGLTATVASLGVVVNRTSSTTAPNTVLDFVNSDNNTQDTNAASRTIATGPGHDPVTLDVDGDEGSLTVVQTNLTLDVFGFVQVSGSLAFKQATGSFVLTNGTTHTSNTTTLANVKYVEVGGHVDTGSAGVGGIGFNLTGIDFAALLVSDTKGTATTADDVNYTTFKADVDSASFVGIGGLTPTLTSLSVVANRTSATGAGANTVLDFVNTAETVNTTDTNAASRTIATGPGHDPVTLDVDGDEGALTAVMTNLTLDVFGFARVTGSLAFKQATGSFVLTNGTTHTSDTTTLANVKYLEVGGHVDTGFAGVGSVGFTLTGMDFGAVLVNDTKGTISTADDVNYTTIKADVDAAALTGIEGLTATVTSLSVVVNRTSATGAGANTVLDFVNTAETVNTTDTNAAGRTIATGPGHDPVTGTKAR
jgi:hypothetical protein